MFIVAQGLFYILVAVGAGIALCTWLIKAIERMK